MRTPRLTKNAKTITCIMDNFFVPLVVPRLSSSSSSSSASASRPKDQSKSSGGSEASTDPVTTRRANNACWKPMQTNPDKQVSENRGSHTQKTRWTKRIQRKAFPIGYSPSPIIWRTWRRMSPHILLKERSQIWKVMLQKWRHKNGSTVFILTISKDRNCDICSRTQNYEGSVQKTR